MRFSLRHANNLLLAAIVLINVYIIATPLWPLASYWWQDHHSSKRTQLTERIHAPTQHTNTTATSPNGLIIPAMLLDQPTLEGSEKDWSAVLKNGIWRWPASSTPDKGGNTVFLAHRFSYTGPHGAFYYLNKLHIGDEIGVLWDNKIYRYKVFSVSEVPPTQTSIEDNTSDARITLFTCTPLWHPVNRLVVAAKLESENE